MNTSAQVSAAEPVSPVTPLPHRIPSLDGLRAISIMLVLIGHAVETFHHHNKLFSLLMVILANSSLGVLIFFVISGFLITTLLLGEYEKTGGIKLSDFYLRRAFRIFPAFYCYMGLIFVLWMLGSIHLTWPIFGTAALFLRNYSAVIVHTHPSGDWFVGHTWTLAVEEQFYWLWPLCLILVKPSKAVIVAVTLIALAPFLRTAEYFVMPGTREQIPIMLHTRMDTLMFGCLAALLYKNAKFQQMLATLYRLHVPLMAAIFMFCISPFLAQKLRGVYYLPIGWTLESACATLVVLWAINHSETKLGSLLNSRFFVHVGVISYSLYLWQQFFLTNLNPLHFDKFPLNLVFAIIAAEISYFGIEKPILTWRRKLKLTHAPISA